MPDQGSETADPLPAEERPSEERATEEPSAGPRPTAPRLGRHEIVLVPSNVWRIGLVVLAVIALGLILRFFVQDAGSVIFTILMSWFAAIAMAPLVNRLSRHMKRGVATILVMLAFIVLMVVFVVAFGALMVSQLTELVARIPDLLDAAIEWLNSTFSMTLTQESILSSIGGDSDVDFGSIAAEIGPNLLGYITSFLGSVFGLFTFALFAFYFSARMPELERWITSLFPARSQRVVGDVWHLTAEKTGGYVGARVILALLSSVCSGIVFALIGMPFWLPLAMWTGIVAQFVPTIGTYIAITLPVLVGALSPNPWLGAIALVWGLLYQQIENLTIEPKISARAVDVNPAVSFGAVLMGTALFGIAGAFLAVPVVAMLLALLGIYGKRYELESEMAAPPTDQKNPTDQEVKESP
jgi:predicted PurR-regulated permease PerM